MSQPPMKDLPFNKVEPVRIFEQAMDQIRELIATGALSSGERLPNELDLSKHLNVSRSSVREALRVLEAEGIVEVRRGSGTFVATQKITVDDGRTELERWLEMHGETIEQVLEVREYIEGLTAALATIHASKAEIDNVRQILAGSHELVSAIREDDNVCIDELARLDAAFHLAISSASGNDIANEIIARIIPAFNESNKAVLYLCHRAVKMEKEHMDILAALETRDPGKAEAAMRHHIRRVKNDLQLFEHHT